VNEVAVLIDWGAISIRRFEELPVDNRQVDMLL